MIHITNPLYTPCALFMILLLCACGPSQADLDATATQDSIAMHATQTAEAPTSTPIPTNTSTPTTTATPTVTRTPTIPPTNTPTPAPGMSTSTLENGWTLYKAQADGFAIALPPEWMHIELNPESFEDTLAVTDELYPELGGIFTSETFRSLIASGIKFYGLDPSIEAISLGSPTTISILMVDLGLEIPLDTLVAINLEELKRIADPNIPIANQRITLSNFEAEELTYTAEMLGFGGDPVPMIIKQIILVDGSLQYVVTLGAPMELAESYSVTFEEIVNSFQIIN